jgi:hypothetical protein
MSRDLALQRSKELQREFKQLNDLISESQLTTLCAACGWHGGTFWQVVDEIRRLKAVEAKTRISVSLLNQQLTTTEANARLIAAAPELLQILQELKQSAYYWSEYDVPIGIVERINTAISKATGEAP